MTDKDEVRLSILEDHLLTDVGPETKTATCVGGLGEHDVYELDPPFKGYDRVVIEQFRGFELLYGLEEDGSFDEQDSIAESMFSVLDDLGYYVP